MPIKYFTVQEANDLLPQIAPLMGQLLERRARAVTRRQALGPLLDDYRSNVGGTAASELVRDFDAIETLLQQIVGFGVEVKDVNAGLIDFLSRRDGREVYLCWRYGEPRIAFYHDLETGFNGRQPL
ncbi:MAG: DUF2203 domain-containing protein [Anaerolineales bacterium]|nr:DUF2203 domain-containing protein [Anaerolineales bacterium]